METPEPISGIQRYSQHSNPCRERVPPVMQVEAAHMADEQVSDRKIKKPHKTLVRDEDSPCPGGFANGD